MIEASGSITEEWWLYVHTVDGRNPAPPDMHETL